MKWISGQALRTVEKRAIEERGMSGYRLMCRAGAALARMAAYLASAGNTRSIVVVAGHGNNGGDGFVAAKCLHEDGFLVTVLMTCLPAALRGSAKEAWMDLHMANVPFKVLSTLDRWEKDPWMDSAVFPRKAIVIDALLGTGLQGAPDGVMAAAIQWMNGTHASCKVCSADLPSGMDSDTGLCPGVVVKADATVTFSRPKKGFLRPEAEALLGHLEVADIGVPGELLEAGESDEAVELVAAPELRRLMPPRPRDAHKGMFGHALVIGGSAAYPNAPVMASIAALRIGAGLVTLAGPEVSRTALAAWLPEAIFTPTDGLPDYLALPMEDYSAIAVGPGMGPGEKVEALVQHLFDQTQKRVIIDADGLNALARLYERGWRPVPVSAQRVIITPHVGEAARLLGCEKSDVQADRIGAVKKLAERYQCIAVLKGAGTLICEPGGKPWLALTGNPGMATAGSGDVLTGMIVGLLAKNHGCLNAAQIGVWIHGATGDYVSIERGAETMTAMMIVERLHL